MFPVTLSTTRLGALLLVACATALPSPAQSAHPPAQTTPLLRTEQAFRAAQANTGTLRAFLVDMPKGADLHIHLGGAVYAESYIHEAAEDGLCFDIVSESLEVPDARSGKCTPGTEASALPHKQALYDGLVDSLSMRDFVPTAQQSGHDHFFAAFDKVKAVSKRHRGEWLAEVTDRAAAQNEQYVEVMETLDEGSGAQLGARQGIQLPDKAAPADFTSARDVLIKGHLREGVADAATMLDNAEAQRRFVQHCDEPARARPGCAVTVRYLFQVLRGIARDAVFAQTLLAFEVAAADPRVVGLNYVMPEDGYASMHDYALQMQWLGWFRDLYPQVHLSLHAGELAPGLVPPDGMRNHVRLAVEAAHAERIGHGVDVLWEDNAGSLLQEMAARHVMVEVNLTSNDIILNVKGKEHPLPVYLARHVPVALSTDDEGVSRIDITHEYLRAAQEFGLGYAELKQLARTSVAHTFLPGSDLWAQPDTFVKTAAPCGSDLAGSAKPSSKCAAFLNGSPHAQQEWQLEQRFRAFELRFGTAP